MKLRQVFTQFAKKSGLFAAGAVLIVSALSAGVVTFTQPTVASATCTPQDQYPLTNVIYCGLSGSTASSLKSSFQSYYTSGQDTNGNKDLQAVYNAVGFKTGMLTSGTWAVGTSYPNGTIVVNGQVVATNVQIASRCYLANMANCQPASRYTYLAGKNVYTRDATWFFDTSAKSKQTLVHIDATGGADFALWTGCGNALKFKVPRSLQCVSLTKEADSTLKYTFTAKASEQNQANGKMFINFGDGSTSQTVAVNQSVVTFTTSHTYTQLSIAKTYTAQVAIGVTTMSLAGNCKVTINIPPKESQKSLVCVQLTAVKPEGGSDGARNFTATASAQNTTISSYTFDFGDGSKQTVVTSAATAKASHTYGAGTFTARVSVTGPLGTFTADSCTAPINVQTPPPPLPNTGPGSVLGIFGATSILGGAFHQFVLRRKLNI